MTDRVERSNEPEDHTAMQARPTTNGGVAQSTRERILDIALNLFVRKGYAETSLREIAAEIGFSKAALYYHFESKQDILLALHMRLHGLTEGVLPLLDVGAVGGDTWERLVDRLIGFALRNRRLIELHLRNREATADLHRGAALENHGGVSHREDLEGRLQALLMDPSLPIDRRVRMMASMGAVAGVLLGSSAFADVPDADLETALRGVVHDLLGSRSG